MMHTGTVQGSQVRQKIKPTKSFDARVYLSILGRTHHLADCCVASAFLSCFLTSQQIYVYARTPTTYYTHVQGKHCVYAYLYFTVKVCTSVKIISTMSSYTTYFIVAHTQIKYSHILIIAHHQQVRHKNCSNVAQVTDYFGGLTSKCKMVTSQEGM